METRRVVVTGMSVIAANGNDKNEFFENSLNGVGGIRKTNLFPSDQLRTDYFGQVQKEYVYEIQSAQQDTRLENIFDDLCTDLLLDSGITVDDIRGFGYKAGFSFATSVGTNDYTTAHVKGILVNALSKSNLHKLPVKLGIQGPIFTNTSACSAGTTAIGTGFSLIKAGNADMVVAGGIDPLTEFSSYGFHALQSLSKEPCKPFDKNRSGISIGEGGALFLLEELQAAKSRNAKIYGEIIGYGLGNDAYHPTSPDPTGKGAYRVMSQAIEQSGLASEDIDYINAHGTGTVLNDDMEVKAMNDLGGNYHVSSTKSLIGHCLAAAGAIEMAATVLCVSEGAVFPTINSVDVEFDYPKITFVKHKGLDQPVKYALSNSFAFGGNAASILIGAYKDE
ncbi:beta-ketoacyl-[acyl-carrier-protein] synthase family protein [Paenibacillus donghaensis]|uniref:beta-ketoacyl-[acyl-carrier-protein] synthase family protein n=1 Tax=Paenibacillus donghaensis TaxID=414771 RepID=UPI001883C4A7|nr:beta-ketoacyl-[acyl-carrier-protein] synthase family protein [Paenibacillus donghaensis]MBE9915095.1 beta-ketoacyl-[acyl-carrier-protein] synthase family protein [Paenibacillus donghaensis]